MKKTGTLMAAGLIALSTFAAAPAATAAPSNDVPRMTEGIVIAQDTSVVLSATPSAPRAVSIQTKPNQLVRLMTKGKKTRTVRTDKEGHAEVAKLSAGRTYNVSTSDSTTTVVRMSMWGRHQTCASPQLNRSIRWTSRGATSPPWHAVGRP